MKTASGDAWFQQGVRSALPMALAMLLGWLPASPVLGQFTGTNFITGNADGAVASTATSTAVGTNSLTGGTGSTAIGSTATASGLSSTSVGSGASALGDYATALGRSTSATGVESTAVGFNSISGNFSTAVGSSTFATANQATAVGVLTTASGFRSSAFGQGAVASGDDSTAIGNNAQASGFNATALGESSGASFANSTAIGNSTNTTRANQMALGNTSNTYTAAGITSAASTAAQSGPVEIVTTDSQGNLASATPAQLGFASVGDFQALRADLDRTTEGVAMAMALSGIPSVLPEYTNYAISTNWGGFAGESALAIGGAARLSDNLFLNGGGAFGTGGRASGGGRAGVTVAW